MGGGIIGEFVFFLTLLCILQIFYQVHASHKKFLENALTTVNVLFSKIKLSNVI